MDNKKPTLGILGGMGPYATLKFYEILLDLTQTNNDSDHLHTVLDVNPHIPSRSRFYLYGETSPVPQMIDACRRLEAYPVDLIALPCNSACAFVNEIQPHVGIEILNIIKVTAQAAVNRFDAGTRISVLGGVVTTENQTYRPFLESCGMVYCPHSLEIQQQSDSIIYGVKSNSKVALDLLFESLLENVAQQTGAQAVILGCTEFACLLPIESKISIVDSTTELAISCLKYAKDSVT